MGMRVPLESLMITWNYDNVQTPRAWRSPNPINCLDLLLRKDNFVITCAIGMLYMVFCCIHTTFSTQFIPFFHLIQWQAGLIHLPFGLGGTIASVFSGRLMDERYKKVSLACGLSTHHTVGDQMDDFPIEKARLSCIWVPVLGCGSIVIAFGWVLRRDLVSAWDILGQYQR